jgi:hypothetical protein
MKSLTRREQQEEEEEGGRMLESLRRRAGKTIVLYVPAIDEREQERVKKRLWSA